MHHKTYPSRIFKMAARQGTGVSCIIKPVLPGFSKWQWGVENCLDASPEAGLSRDQPLCSGVSKNTQRLASFHPKHTETPAIRGIDTILKK
jgi:hypothetical protein